MTLRLMLRHRTFRNFGGFRRHPLFSIHSPVSGSPNEKIIGRKADQKESQPEIDLPSS